MDDRTQRILDGDEARLGLDARQALALAEAEDMIHSVLRGIPSQPLPDLGPAVLQRINATSPHALSARTNPFRRIADWIWSPRPISLHWRPAYAFACLAFLVAVTLTRGPSSPVAPAAAQQVLVQFRLDAPSAAQVSLAGNFTNWQPNVSMKRTDAGVWTVVVPLTPGVHKYAFVVNGEQWVPDPMAQPVSDGFGGLNSQLAVLTPDQSRSL